MMTQPRGSDLPDLALYQPDIAGNTGTLLRLAACLDFTIHIIEPAGFRLDDANLRRAGMDYLELAKLTRHVDWQEFENWCSAAGRRIILMTTKAATHYHEFAFLKNDIILLGRESSGVPDHVHAASDHRVVIPMQPATRSINLALSGALVMGEALRQTGGFRS